MDDITNNKYEVSILKTSEGFYLNIAGIGPQIPLCITNKDNERTIHPETANFMKYIQNKNGKKAPDYYLNNGFIKASGLTGIGEILKKVLLEYDELETYRALINGSVGERNEKYILSGEPSTNVLALLETITIYHKKENLYPFLEEFDEKTLPTSGMDRSTLLAIIEEAKSMKYIIREDNMAYRLTEIGETQITTYLKQRAIEKQKDEERKKRNVPKPHKHQPRDENPHKKWNDKKPHWTDIQNPGIRIIIK